MKITIRLIAMFFLLLILQNCTKPPATPAATSPPVETAVLSIDSAEVIEGDNGTRNLAFKIFISNTLDYDVSVSYETNDGTAIVGSDYTAGSGRATIAKGETSTLINISVNGDTDIELTEKLKMTYSLLFPGSVTFRGSVKTKTTSGYIVSDDIEQLALNDTGVTFGANYPSGNNINCIGETISQQDCSYGRDNTHNDDSDGYAGFSYTKIDANGDDFTSSLSAWSCVKDNVTGLTWEVKHPADSGLHQSNDIFYWSEIFNGAPADYAVRSCFGYDSTTSAPTYCSTADYVARVNASNLCGASDWRLPTHFELLQLTNLSRPQLTIDERYFPNTHNNNFSRTYSTADFNGGISVINFAAGYTTRQSVFDYFSVRLVRDKTPNSGGGGDTDGPPVL